jgi:DNA uptake protein ComE-like DNA-binding protein
MISILFGAVFVVSPPLPASEALVQAKGVNGEVFASPSAIRVDMLIDINSATPDQLKTLAGIGDVYAKRIMEGRPYQSTDELLKKKIIPQTTYDKIKDQTVARPK